MGLCDYIKSNKMKCLRCKDYEATTILEEQVERIFQDEWVVEDKEGEGLHIGIPKDGEITMVPINNWTTCKDCYNYLRDEDNIHALTCHLKKWIQENKKLNNDKVIWYSCRPGPNEEIEEGSSYKFCNRIDKFMKANCIESAFWVYEWKYKEIDNYKSSYGIHMHSILIGENKKINQHIKRQHEMYFNCNPGQKVLIKKSYVQDKIDYMTGITWEEEKNLEKINNNNKRKEIGLKQYETKNWDFESLGVVVKNITTPVEANLVESEEENSINPAIVTFD